MKKWMKNTLIVMGILLTQVFIAHPRAVAQAVVTTAGLELANVFQKVNTFAAGISLTGSNSGTVLMTAAPTTASYTFQLPSTAPIPNQVLQAGLTPGTYVWSASCGGFQASGDLSGNGTNQVVVGMNGIDFDQTSTPQDGFVLKYNQAKNTFSWQPE